MVDMWIIDIEGICNLFIDFVYLIYNFIIWVGEFKVYWIVNLKWGG